MNFERLTKKIKKHTKMGTMLGLGVVGASQTTDAQITQYNQGKIDSTKTELSVHALTSADISKKKEILSDNWLDAQKKFSELRAQINERILKQNDKTLEDLNKKMEQAGALFNELGEVYPNLEEDFNNAKKAYNDYKDSLITKEERAALEAAKEEQLRTKKAMSEFARTLK